MHLYQEEPDDGLSIQVQTHVGHLIAFNMFFCIL